LAHSKEKKKWGSAASTNEEIILDRREKLRYSKLGRVLRQKGAEEGD